jgi:hypothetical protein
MHRTGARKNRFLFLDLLRALARISPGVSFRRVSVGADHYRIHTAGDVRRWLARHPRLVLLWLPRYCPQANPIEPILGDRHDQIPRHHRHHTLPPLWAEAQRYWRPRAHPGQLPSIYHERAVESARRHLRQKLA